MSKTIILEKVKSTEKIVRQIEVDNVLVFVVDRAISKPEIRDEVEDLFDVSKTYTATCPICEGQNLFDGPTAIIDTKIPSKAVKIEHVAKL